MALKHPTREVEAPIAPNALLDDAGHAQQNLSETSAPDHQAADETPYDGTTDEELITAATRRFKQALESSRDDFETVQVVQDFVAGDQWPQSIKRERESFARPCLTLDHLNQYVRHVVNSGMQRRVDIRVLPLNDEGDDEVAEVLAGMERQIVQTSTARVAYETGLRHACQVGFGNWRVKAVPSGCTHPTEGTPLLEIVVRRIPDPRMVIWDPFVEYPDGRDARFCFVLTKMSVEDYKEQYEKTEPPTSWHMMDGKEVLPWAGTEGSCVVAEYYYVMPDGTLCWAVLTPDDVLARGVHHGNAIPVVRCVGEEYEDDGKQRHRGMVEPAMDAQRAYNYSSSAFIEAVALAPIAPFVAADGQIEQFVDEWKDAHRVPRAVLRYKPVSTSGQLAPPPQRSQPAGIPQGWQGMMTNLIQDTQMIMGLSQPSVLGTGGGSPQTGDAVTAQQAPGDINTFHFHEHWFQAIEQTGRVIMSMIPTVYTLPQAVKIVGDDGVRTTALINPAQEQPVQATGMDGMGGQEDDAAQDAAALIKVFDKSYNPCLGKYDVAITLGPSSATKKQESNKTLMTMINAVPSLMDTVGDLLFSTMDVPNADIIAKRMRDAKQAINPQAVAQMQQQMQQLQQQNQQLEQMVLAEQQKSQASLQKAQMDNATKLQEAQLDADVRLEIAMRDNINAMLLERMKTNTQISTAIIKALSAADKQTTREGRLEGYGGVMADLAAPVPEPVPQPVQPEGVPYGT